MRNARVKPRFLIRGDGVPLGNVGRGRTCLKRVGSSIANAGVLTECVVCPSDRVGDTRDALFPPSSQPRCLCLRWRFPRGRVLCEPVFHLPDTPESDSGAGPLQLRGTLSCPVVACAASCRCNMGSSAFFRCRTVRASLLSGSSRGANHYRPRQKGEEDNPILGRR